MISVVERSLYEVGGDDPLALDVDVAADVAVVAGRHQHCGRFRRHLLKYFFLFLTQNKSLICKFLTVKIASGFSGPMKSFLNDK